MFLLRGYVLKCVTFGEQYAIYPFSNFRNFGWLLVLFTNLKGFDPKLVVKQSCSYEDKLTFLNIKGQLLEAAASPEFNDVTADSQLSRAPISEHWK